MIDAFTTAYLEAALWSSMDNSNEQGGEPLDKNYTIADLAPEALALAVKDCARFQEDNAETLATAECSRGSGEYSTLAQAGHDFWLTRNGHGCGFWDGDWSEPEGEALDAASKAFGETSLDVGDDGQLYAYPTIARRDDGTWYDLLTGAEHKVA